MNKTGILTSELVEVKKEVVVEARQLSVEANGRSILNAINLQAHQNTALGILGPSGVGKSTLLKCFNRLTDLHPGLEVKGEILFQNQSIFSPGIDVDHLRAQIGMIFQQPVVFPKSIFENVIFGAVRLRKISKSEQIELAEKALREAAVWNELKDRLKEPALRLSVGQQQRLCLARTLALNPQVILLDEPTSALDPKTSEAIEELMKELKKSRTLVLVTHQPAQAQNVCDRVFELKSDSSG